MAAKNELNSLFNMTSRYVKGGETESANGRLEWWERSKFTYDASDAVYIVEDITDRRPDRVADIFYGSSHYWWFIAQYNNILDPFSEMTAGTALRIPVPDRMALMVTGRTGGITSKRELSPVITAVVV